MSILLADGWVVTLNEQRDVLERASVLIEGDRIAAASSRSALEARSRGCEILDCSGSIIIPGTVERTPISSDSRQLLKNLLNAGVLGNCRALKGNIAPRSA
jgi:hypothetical protein